MKKWLISFEDGKEDAAIARATPRHALANPTLDFATRCALSHTTSRLLIMDERPECDNDNNNTFIDS